jgi:hypothetical protein
MDMARQTLLLSGTVLLALGALGCATEGPKPTEEMTRARTLVEQADKGNAQRYAAADLQKAHDELNDAEKASDARKYDEARNYAESAEVDADVAMARGNAGDSQRAAAELRRDNATLQNEADRNANAPGVTPITATPPLEATPPANTSDAGVSR